MNRKTTPNSTDSNNSNQTEIINQCKKENSITNKLIKIVSNNNNAAMLCIANKNNPNYFSIFYINEKFSKLFRIDESQAIGQDYDFLFKNIDVDSNSKDQIEYINLIKAIKDFKSCEIIIGISDFHKNIISNDFKINFIPSEIVANNTYGIFIFEKINDSNQSSRENHKQNNPLLHNLERMLRNERLLRDLKRIIILKHHLSYKLNTFISINLHNYLFHLSLFSTHND